MTFLKNTSLPLHTGRGFESNLETAAAHGRGAQAPDVAAALEVRALIMFSGDTGAPVASGCVSIAQEPSKELMVEAIRLIYQLPDELFDRYSEHRRCGVLGLTHTRDRYPASPLTGGGGVRLPGGCPAMGNLGVHGQVREEVVLGALEAVVLWDLVEEFGVLHDEVVELLDVGDRDLVLLGQREDLDELDPAGPRRVLAHLVRQQGAQDLEAVHN